MYKTIINLVLISICEGIGEITVPTEDEISRVMTYTYVNEKRPRNEALSICQKLGGTLLVVDSTQVIEMIEHFRINGWQGAPDDDYWTGLSEPSQGVYLFTDCTQVYKDSGFSYFKVESYKSTELCYVGKKSGNLWESKKCSDSKDFICQKTSYGSCTMSDTFSTSYQTSNKTETQCESDCQQNQECWGYLYHDNNYCTALNVNSTATSTNNDMIHLKTKLCYNAVLITNAGELPTVDADNSETPVLNCSEANSNNPVVDPTPVITTSSNSALCEVSTVIQMETQNQTINVTVTETYSDVSTEIYNYTINVTEVLTEMYNHTINITQTQTEVSTEIYNYTINVTQTQTEVSTEIYNHTINVTQTETELITNTQTLISTMYDIQMESVFVTAYITAIETQFLFPSSTCECSTSCDISSEIVISYLPCPSPSCSTTTHTNYITINDTKALQESVEKLKKELTVSPTNTSAHRRKFISVQDPRPSSSAIGYIGLAMLIIPFSIMIITDFPRLFADIKKLITTLKRC